MSVPHVPSESDQTTNIQNAYIVLRAERSDTYFQYLFFLRFFFFHFSSNIEDSGNPWTSKTSTSATHENENDVLRESVQSVMYIFK